MMNKKIKLVFGSTLLALTILVFAGIKMMSKSSDYYQKNATLPVTYMSASWAYNYADFNELTDSSDIIAVVKITGINKEVASDIPMTYYNASVEQSIFSAKIGDKIVIPFTGINNNTKHVEISDDPLPNIGSEYLIFAKRNDDGSYTILSGSEGRYDFNNGAISSLNYTHNSVGKAAIDVHNKNFMDLKSKIQAHKINKEVIIQ